MVTMIADARTVAESVADPELPMLTIADLGILRDVRAIGEKIVVSITPTYTGCPAITEMRANVIHALNDAGFSDVEVRTVLRPAWTTDWITETGRRKLADAGIAPPYSTARRFDGAIPLSLGVSRRIIRCPRCDGTDTEVISEFGATACRSLCRCGSCREPFEYVKEH